jgi:putative heme-binding domain-containing protein
MSASGAALQTNVHVLVPGFAVRELPVRLSNVNNLRFAPAGQLTALGYDGRVWRLRDTDGDGLEDRAEAFWDQPTIRVPVGMAWGKDGLYVSSQGKVSLLRDTDGDGKADTEEIIASGWPKTDVASGGVDATAVTLDAAGNVYFGLITADYSNPYRLRKRKDLPPEEKAWSAARGIPVDGPPDEQVSLYDTNGRRGTIQKWSPQTKQLETIATGIRVPYTLAFKGADLFVSDQEGETWCPNGNPLDELNHVIPGRHYGFPPRHEKWLPKLVSEPPVVAFGPQHQSACGFVFNESSAKQKRFGPRRWEGDAFVAGESRGKIWRVKLVKTPDGYLGAQWPFARLDMLTTDVAISPAGDLYVSCHSGPPDWGTGPKGEGKLFKISHTDPEAPQPLAVWPENLQTVAILFDRALDPAITNRTAEMKIEFGEFVRAGDRFELLKPPYKVVGHQDATPRGQLRVVSATLLRPRADASLLRLTTDPHPQAVTYALTLPGVAAAGRTAFAATVDLEYDFHGAQMSREGTDALPSEASSKWRPHLDSWLSNVLLPGAPWPRDVNRRADRPGRLSLHTLVAMPAGEFTLRLESNAPFEAQLGDMKATARRAIGIQHAAEFKARWGEARVPLRVAFNSGATRAMPTLHVVHSTAEDPTVRPLPRERLFVPWAPPPHPPPPRVSSKTNEFTGGDWHRGRALFFSEQLKCATCHRLRGEGGTLAVDLGNLIHRDPASVLRDIRDPNAAINPDYVAFHIALRDGEELSGLVRAASAAALRVVTADGKETVVPRAQVRELKPAALSLMPVGLLDALNEGQVKDLLTFLVSETPQEKKPAAQAGSAAVKPAKPQPPQRTRAEVEAVIGSPSSPSPIANSKALHLVLVASKQDHGPGEHDYPAWQTNWARLLAQAEGVQVSTAWKWPTPEQFKAADVLVFYYWNHAWSPEVYRQLDDFLARGGGVVLLHSSCIADTEPEPLAERIGLAAQPQRTKYRHGALDLTLTAPPDHPITRGLPRQIHFVDETYWPMIGEAGRVEVLATAAEEGKPWPMLWTFRHGRGRVFGSILGHYAWTHDDPFFRVLVLRGIAWAAREDTRRLERLALGDRP